MSSYFCFMTWEEVQEKYQKRIAQFVPQTHRSAIIGFQKMEEILRKFYPHVFASPEILADMKIHEFSKEVPFQLSDNILRTFKWTRKIIHNASTIDNPQYDPNADLTVFKKKDVTLCFSRWLKANGWKNINSVYVRHSGIDVTAEKEEQKLVCFSMDSVWKIKRWKDELEEENIGFKSRLGKIFILAMEALNKSPGMMLYILIPDDVATLEFFMPYFPHLKKFGFRAFKVKSAAQVNEIII